MNMPLVEAILKFTLDLHLRIKENKHRLKIGY